MRMAVVGAGRWGCLHAEKLAGLNGVELVAIVDGQLERAQAVARLNGAPLAVASLAELPDDVQAVTVAVDINELGRVSRALLETGRHVFVEKPGAPDYSVALDLTALAEAQGVVLAGGFIERFNPDLILHRGQASRIVAWRAGVDGWRGQCPIQDWMAHDLDLANYLTESTLKVVRVRRTVGRMSCLLKGDADEAVRLTVSAHSTRPRRKIWIDGRRYDLCAHGRDLLLDELSAFVSTVRGRADSRLARGRDICRVMRLVDRVRQPLSIAA